MVSPLFSAEVIAQARELVPTVAGAVLTLGVATVAYGKAGQLFMGDSTDRWRAMTMAEVKSNIEDMISTLQTLNPDIQIFLTLSPVPLNRTPWHASSVIADCVSKSTIRIAIEEVLQNQPHNVYYWPAFEIVRWLGAHRPGHYGADDGLLRHVSNDIVNVITSLFIERFFAS